MTERGTAMVEWLLREPLDDLERAARADMEAARALNAEVYRIYRDAVQAMEDLAGRLQAESRDAGAGRHADRWIDGYRVGVAHAQEREAFHLINMARAMVLALKREASDGG